MRHFNKISSAWIKLLLSRYYAMPTAW